MVWPVTVDRGNCYHVFDASSKFYALQRIVNFPPSFDLVCFNVSRELFSAYEIFHVNTGKGNF